jgi:hypothetical protein
MKRIQLTVLLLAAAFMVKASPTDPSKEKEKTTVVKKDHSYRPLRLKLNEDGSKYVRFLMWHQFWTRYTEYNPGTGDVNGNPATHSFDIGLRRSRFLALAQMSPRFFFVTHWGINNQTFINGGADGSGNNVSSGNKKPGIFIHGAWAEYAIIPSKLQVGAGLHYWNGISRMTNASTVSFMTLDAPIHNWPTIELTDQFGRQFGVFAKGKLGKLDYRLAINKPFVYGKEATSAQAVNIKNEELATQGYFQYQFRDQESNLLPYMTGTYMGGKSVFNIGAGFHLHPNATGSLQDNQLQTHDIQLFGVDAFFEQPIGKGMAISAYTSLYSYDFGPGYIRNVGIMNTGQSISNQESPEAKNVSFNGVGNAQPTIGTGTISYTQVGLALPKLANDGQFMPYATFTYKNFEALNEASTQYDIGLNYFVSGHNAKITAQYSTRPVYGQDKNLPGSAGEFTVQTQIFL